MAYTPADLDRIDMAIASGVSEVEYSDGSRVRYRSLAELRAARADIKASLAGAGAASNRRVTVAGF